MKCRGHNGYGRLPNGAAAWWGYGGDGNLGNTGAASSATPVVVSSVTGAVDIASADNHTCVVTSAGVVRCWGYNGNDQLGYGATSGLGAFSTTRRAS